MIPGELGPSDAAILETFVVPRYLRLFGDVVLESILPAEGAKLLHLGCRTGYPELEVAERLSMANLVGLDPAPRALELARTKAQLLPVTTRVDHVVGDPFSVPYEDQSFSHALSLCPPIPGHDARRRLFAELGRLVAPSGQILLGLPMRGSFQELLDLFREHALKNDAGDIAKATDTAALNRPNPESITEELEAAGFDDVDVEVVRASLSWKSARDFFEDPVTRLLILPDLEAHFDGVDLTRALKYAREAIDRYWSESDFELTVVIGCVSGRRY
ncbi:MAG: class I SAM-dependent methyltransferase [Polyangiaceae bacterium]|nr:class I SAM-dependent methyltransferase [Polyangiaceae bacterium]